jgi:Ca2+-binding EF-hand superfamily protein
VGESAAVSRELAQSIRSTTSSAVVHSARRTTSLPYPPLNGSVVPGIPASVTSAPAEPPRTELEEHPTPLRVAAVSGLSQVPPSKLISALEGLGVVSCEAFVEAVKGVLGKGSHPLVTADSLTESLTRLFHVMDVNHNGTLEVGEMIAATLLLSHADFYSRAEATFDAIDTDRDGLLSVSELETCLVPLFSMLLVERPHVCSAELASALRGRFPERSLAQALALVGSHVAMETVRGTRRRSTAQREVEALKLSRKDWEEFMTSLKPLASLLLTREEQRTRTALEHTPREDPAFASTATDLARLTEAGKSGLFLALAWVDRIASATLSSEESFDASSADPVGMMSSTLGARQLSLQLLSGRVRTLATKMGLASLTREEVAPTFLKQMHGAEAISLEQFQSALGELPGRMNVDASTVTAVFRAIDTGHSGSVSKEELAAGLAVLCSGSPMLKAGQAFEAFDLDGGGFISRQELTSCLAALFALAKVADPSLFLAVGAEPGELAVATAALAFQQGDSNRDGRLSKEEWMHWLAQQYQQCLSPTITLAARSSAEDAATLLGRVGQGLAGFERTEVSEDGVEFLDMESTSASREPDRPYGKTLRDLLGFDAPADIVRAVASRANYQGLVLFADVVDAVTSVVSESTSEVGERARGALLHRLFLSCTPGGMEVASAAVVGAVLASLSGAPASLRGSAVLLAMTDSRDSATAKRVALSKYLGAMLSVRRSLLRVAHDWVAESPQLDSNASPQERTRHSQALARAGVRLLNRIVPKGASFDESLFLEWFASRGSWLVDPDDARFAAPAPRRVKDPPVTPDMEEDFVAAGVTAGVATTYAEASAHSAPLNAMAELEAAGLTEDLDDLEASLTSVIEDVTQPIVPPYPLPDTDTKEVEEDLHTCMRPSLDELVGAMRLGGLRLSLLAAHVDSCVAPWSESTSLRRSIPRGAFRDSLTALLNAAASAELERPSTAAEAWGETATEHAREACMFVFDALPSTQASTTTPAADPTELKVGLFLVGASNASTSSDARVRDALALCDANSDGTLTRGELALFLKVGFAVSRATATSSIPQRSSVEELAATVVTSVFSAVGATGAGVSLTLAQERLRHMPSTIIPRSEGTSWEFLLGVTTASLLPSGPPSATALRDFFKLASLTPAQACTSILQALPPASQELDAEALAAAVTTLRDGDAPPMADVRRMLNLFQAAVAPFDRATLAMMVFAMTNVPEVDRFPFAVALNHAVRVRAPLTLPHPPDAPIDQHTIGWILGVLSLADAVVSSSAVRMLLETSASAPSVSGLATAASMALRSGQTPRPGQPGWGVVRAAAMFSGQCVADGFWQTQVVTAGKAPTLRTFLAWQHESSTSTRMTAMTTPERKTYTPPLHLSPTASVAAEAVSSPFAHPLLVGEKSVGRASATVTDAELSVLRSCLWLGAFDPLEGVSAMRAASLKALNRPRSVSSLLNDKSAIEAMRLDRASFAEAIGTFLPVRDAGNAAAIDPAQDPVGDPSAALSRGRPGRMVAAHAKVRSFVIRRLWALFDSNQDGVVDAAEMQNAVRRICVADVAARARAVFNAFDADNDGLLSRSEVRTYITSVLRVIVVSGQSLAFGSRSRVSVEEVAAAQCDAVFDEIVDVGLQIPSPGASPSKALRGLTPSQFQRWFRVPVDMVLQMSQEDVSHRPSAIDEKDGSDADTDDTETAPIAPSIMDSLPTPERAPFPPREPERRPSAIPSRLASFGLTQMMGASLTNRSNSAPLRSVQADPFAAPGSTPVPPTMERQSTRTGSFDHTETQVDSPMSPAPSAPPPVAMGLTRQRTYTGEETSSPPQPPGAMGLMRQRTYTGEETSSPPQPPGAMGLMRQRTYTGEETSPSQPWAHPGVSIVPTPSAPFPEPSAPQITPSRRQTSEASSDQSVFGPPIVSPDLLEDRRPSPMSSPPVVTQGEDASSTDTMVKELDDATTKAVVELPRLPPHRRVHWIISSLPQLLAQVLSCQQSGVPAVQDELTLLGAASARIVNRLPAKTLQQARCLEVVAHVIDSCVRLGSVENDALSVEERATMQHLLMGLRDTADQYASAFM